MIENIYKYPLIVIDSQCIYINGLLEILSVVVQRDQLVLYALVDTSSTKITYVDVKIVSAGNMIMFDTKEWDFRGTHTQYGERLIWHVWTRKDE